jgi:hypothetical protein
MRFLLSAFLAPAFAVTAFAGPPPASRVIDDKIEALWKSKNVRPAAPSDDARFFRRLTIDIAGELPTEKDVVAFLASTDPDKRAKAIDKLLAGKDYAEHFADHWDALLMGRLTKSQLVDRRAFRDWLRTQFDKNTPWDKMVRELVTAEGYNTVSTPIKGGTETPPTDLKERHNGAVNWYLKYAQSLPDLSGAASKLFLGVQIQCAQCHDHKTEKWTQKDFRQFTAFFATTRPRPVDTGQVLGVRRVDVKETPRAFGFLAPIGKANREYSNVTPRTLNGPEVRTGERRKALADWMTDKNNPYFARAFVNRMWGYFTGTGFVQPVDDFRPSNEAVAPELLKALADDFVASGYDVKHLIRVICNSKVYQLSSKPSSVSKGAEHEYWSRYPLKPLELETFLSVLGRATGGERQIQNMLEGNEFARERFLRQFVVALGTDDMAEAKDFEETIPQALMLLNGRMTNDGTREFRGSVLAEILASTDSDEKRIERLYLHTLSRRPTAAETKHWTTFVNAPRTFVSGTGGPAGKDEKVGKAKGGFGAGFLGALNKARGAASTPKDQAYEDLFWALINSAEFLLNH